MSILKSLTASLTTLMLCACIALPTNFQSEDSRRNANKRDLRFIIVGETTRGDILRRLGEPDSFHNQQRTLLYRSSRDLLTAFPLVEGADTSAMVQKHRYMVLTFNTAGVLILKERKSDVDWVF